MRSIPCAPCYSDLEYRIRYCSIVSISTGWVGFIDPVRKPQQQAS